MVNDVFLQYYLNQSDFHGKPFTSLAYVNPDGVREYVLLVKIRDPPKSDFQFFTGGFFA